MNDNFCCPYCGNSLCRCCCCKVIKGAQGVQGIQGIQGERGEKGERGMQGERGEKGEQGIQGIQGDRGETGEQGIQGIQGERGEKGDSGDILTTANMSAIHTGGATFDVTREGVLIPLNGARILNKFTSTAPYTNFTVQESGTYYLNYNIKTVTATTVKTRVILNGAPLSGTTRSTSVADTNFILSILIALNSGDSISLQLFDMTDSVRLQGGTGAALVLFRVN